MRLALKLTRAIDWLSELVGRATYWLALLMILIGVYNATARYLGSYVGVNLASNAYLEAQWYLFGAIFMLAAGYGLRHDVHVRVDVLYSRLSEKGRAWIEILGTLIFLLPFCIMVLWLSIDWVGFSWQIRETSPNPGGLIRYPIKLVVPIAFILLFLQGISHLIKALAVLSGHRSALREPEPENVNEVGHL
jgi:TRAP-type mannitol/chloroaromatic compound transport system permease small subunit